MKQKFKGSIKSNYNNLLRISREAKTILEQQNRPKHQFCQIASAKWLFFVQFYELFTIAQLLSFFLREILRGSRDNLKLNIQCVETIHAKGKGYQLTQENTTDHRKTND